MSVGHKPFIEAYLKIFTDMETGSVHAMLNATPTGCAWRIQQEALRPFVSFTLLNIVDSS